MLKFFPGHRKLPLILYMIACYSPAYSQEFIRASYYGSSIELRDFIKHEMVYPQEELTKGIEGTVILNFLISKDGRIEKIKIVESVSPGIDGEAIRIGNKILWNPASFDGEAVEDNHNLAIRFDISKYNKWCRERGYVELEYPYKPIDTSNLIYAFNTADEPPEAIFDDPAISLIEFLSQNIRYPEAALNLNISGTVKVHFIIETNGLPSNIMVKDYLGAGCAEEAIRLVKMVKWRPGIKNGKAVRTAMYLNITFNLADRRNFKN